jgi:hypothetical protein
MPSMSSDYDEKRNFIRMFVNATVRITDPSTGKSYDGQGKNLSGDGALFNTKEKFNLNQKLSLEISTEQSKLSSLSAMFEVKRVDELAEGGYEVAGTMLSVK